MLSAVIPYFKEIYSIELDKTHFKNTQIRFVGYPNINILQGQSDKVLPEVLRSIDEPCLFWLDAHWSDCSTAKGETETPFIQKLQCISNHTKAQDRITLIDDTQLTDKIIFRGWESCVNSYWMVIRTGFVKSKMIL